MSGIFTRKIRASIDEVFMLAMITNYCNCDNYLLH